MLWQCAGLGWMDWTAKPRRSHYSLGRRGTHARKMARLACWVFAPFEMSKEQPVPVLGSLSVKPECGLENGKAMAIILIHVVEGKRKTEIDSTFHLAISFFCCQSPLGTLDAAMSLVLFPCSSPS